MTRGHHAAMPYEKVARFLGEVRKRDAMGALAIEFTVLTAARTGEVLGATWTRSTSSRPSGPSRPSA